MNDLEQKAREHWKQSYLNGGSQSTPKLMADFTQTIVADIRTKLEEFDGKPRCRGCLRLLVLCPHCSGSDSSYDAGAGQRGYDICDNTDCEEYEGCCGC